jgi:hypothetical protein
MKNSKVMRQKHVSKNLSTEPTYYILYTENMIPGTKTFTQLKFLIKSTSILLQKSDSRSRKKLLGLQAREIAGMAEAKKLPKVREGTPACAVTELSTVRGKAGHW